MLASIVMVRLQKSYQNVSVSYIEITQGCGCLGGRHLGLYLEMDMGEPSNFKSSSKVGVFLFFLFFKPGDKMNL